MIQTCMSVKLYTLVEASTEGLSALGDACLSQSTNEQVVYAVKEEQTNSL